MGIGQWIEGAAYPDQVAVAICEKWDRRNVNRLSYVLADTRKAGISTS